MPAQLIPTAGVGGAVEQERRATSSLLAVLGAVSEFGRAVTSQIGAPTGKIETFIEVGFRLGDKTVIPDGLIRVTRGRRVWTALVEVKTGDNQLRREQVEAYLDVAREQGFDAVLTISNQIPAVYGQHPVEVDKRKTRKVDLQHLSWTRLLTMAVVERNHKGVSDPDQAWILGEMIRYLENPRSGAMPTVDMGDQWVAIRDSARQGTLRANDKGLAEVVQRWEQLIYYAALILSRDLGTNVDVALSKKEKDDPRARLDAVSAALVGSGRLESHLSIPDTAGQITVYADLRTRHVGASMEIAAPKEGRPRTRVNWLLRQLRGAPPQLIVDSVPQRSRDSLSEPLARATEQPDLLVDPQGRPLVKFTVSLIQPMGQKRAIGKGGFPTTVIENLVTFYESTAQKIKPWTPSAPQVKRETPKDEAPVVATNEVAVPVSAFVSTYEG